MVWGDARWIPLALFFGFPLTAGQDGREREVRSVPLSRLKLLAVFC